VSESLEEQSVRFATELQETLDGVLPGERRVISQRSEAGDRYVVRPEGKSVPLYVDGQHLADLLPVIFLQLDRVGEYLKAVRSDFEIRSVLDSRPLVRLDYRADMNRAPVAHWQVYAERGAFSHLLARAHAVDANRVRKPHDLSSLHFPIGGERFRPCLEDLLQFLVEECGVDKLPGWTEMLQKGRESWRRRQLGAIVRDAQLEAAATLRRYGWTVEPPAEVPSENRSSLTRW
jgi:hypothetical protein